MPGKACVIRVENAISEPSLRYAVVRTRGVSRVAAAAAGKEKIFHLPGIELLRY